MSKEENSRITHVGLDSIFAERDKLLNSFDIAKKQVSDDAVKTEHGNVAEEIFRAYLQDFLPKKYGVTKGYIITPSLEYTDPLEEWDIIVYDALESPTLYIRETTAGDKKRGIPVQYVKSVIEVKSSFTPAQARKAAEKLTKLKKFRAPEKIETSDSNKHQFLNSNMFCATVFFEVLADSLTTYCNALSELLPLAEECTTFYAGTGVIIRGHDRFSSGLLWPIWVGDQELIHHVIDHNEFSVPLHLKSPDGLVAYIVSGGFNVNQFSEFMFNFVVMLNDGPAREYTGYKTNLSGYGIDSNIVARLPLFK